jgi:hypothetical protein
LATFGDLRTYVEQDGWTEEPNLARGRARTGDHRRYQKQLADGTVLRTKVSHGARDEIGTDLFKRVLRDQLRVSEDHFWDVVRGRATEAEPDAAPPHVSTIPGWLVQRLIETAGLPEGEVRAMTAEQAQAAWQDFQTRPRSTGS